MFQSDSSFKETARKILSNSALTFHSCLLCFFLFQDISFHLGSDVFAAGSSRISQCFLFFSIFLWQMLTNSSRAPQKREQQQSQHWEGQPLSHSTPLLWSSCGCFNMVAPLIPWCIPDLTSQPILGNTSKKSCLHAFLDCQFYFKSGCDECFAVSDCHSHQIWDLSDTNMRRQCDRANRIDQCSVIDWFKFVKFSKKTNGQTASDPEKRFFEPSIFIGPSMSAWTPPRSCTFLI